MPPKLKVIWEPVPDPDPDALLEAVAMIFGRRLPPLLHDEDWPKEP
jgi:hypothetical protein